MPPGKHKLLSCPQCGARNRIPSNRSSDQAHCGRCGSSLAEAATQAYRDPHYLLRCTQCQTRNRIPGTKIGQSATCGQCGTAMDTAPLAVKEAVLVNDTDFQSQVIQSPLPVLLFCFASWCPSCQAQAPLMDELAREWQGRVRIAKLNTDHNPQTAAALQVMSVPQTFVYDNTRQTQRLVGAQTLDALKYHMAPYLGG